MHMDLKLEFLIHPSNGMHLLNLGRGMFTWYVGKLEIGLRSDLGYEGFPKKEVCLLESLGLKI